MKKVFVVYMQYLDFQGEEMKIGGIETYINNLSDVVKELGYEYYIYQFSDVNFRKCIDNINVIGVKSKSKKNSKKILQEIYKIADLENDIIIFATNQLNKKNKFKHSIAIQHGIYWDLPFIKGKKLNKLLGIILKSLYAYKEVYRNSLVNTTVCVDYNYMNWYRAITISEGGEFLCIPNFTSINKFKSSSNDECVKIIFARRFEELRGVFLFEKVIDRILKKYNNVNVTFAGSGTYEKYLKEKYNSNSKVEFIKYNAKDSVKIHSEYDVAVIPSIGSEGTSLSLLEAMAAGCAVVVTNIGGMTQIVIDGFNGIIVNPIEQELYEALESLLIDFNLRKELQKKAIDTVEKSFSTDRWKNKWKEIIKY